MCVYNKVAKGKHGIGGGVLKSDDSCKVEKREFTVFIRF